MSERQKSYDEKLKSWRNKARIVGLINTGIGTSLDALVIYRFKDTDPTILRASLETIFCTPYTFLALDGLMDTIKGTHHYLFMKTWQKTTRNPETKLKIQKEIDTMQVKTEKE
ncbi:MAG: hypothetical protein AAB512_01005 [Patescibacteria group bacterium]